MTAGLPEWRAPGTPSAWAPPAVRLRRRLLIKGGFCVDDDRHCNLQEQARRLGFADLRSCLQTLLDDGWSIPQLAAHLVTTHLVTTQPAIRRAIEDAHVRRLPRRERLARQRQRAAQQRAAVRVAEVGFESVRAYLLDRLVVQAWTLAQVEGALGAASSTVRHLLDQHQVWRVGPTRRQRAVPGRGLGPQAQARAAQQRRQARLSELGFAGIEGYLPDRSVGRGWSVRRLCAELGVGHGWVDQQLARLGLRP